MEIYSTLLIYAPIGRFPFVLNTLQILGYESDELKKPFREFIENELGADILLITCGLPCTAKTPIAETISKTKGFPFLRTDVIRREVLKDEDIFEEKIASDMAKRMTVYDEMFRQAEEILSRGGSVVLDATFITQLLRRRAAEIAVKYHKTLVIFQTICPQKVALARIRKRDREDYESNAITEQSYLNNKESFEEVDMDDLKQLNPDLNIIYLLIDTQHDRAENWYIIGMEKK